MTKPDRIARAVEKDFAKDRLRSDMPMGEVRYRMEMAVRREAAYQRARVRKIVQARIQEVDNGSQCEMNTIYRLALSDLLAALQAQIEAEKKAGVIHAAL